MAWDALLKNTGQELELLSDVEMYNFVESGLRGGVSTCGGLRYAKANNPYLKDYDEQKPNSYIMYMYMDMNNLYGWSMSQPLPTGGFEWVQLEDGVLDPDFVHDDEGYIAEVDLEYPEELHDEHNDYPLAPESVCPDEWSEYMQSVGPVNFKTGGPWYGTVSKLIPNLNDKHKYVVHHKALAMYLGMGLKLKRVHRILKFKESPWMAPYIELNTNLRKNAKTDFEKDFFKLMNNAVFGKSMENVRNRIDVKLTVDNDVKKKWIKNPRFKCTKDFNEHLSGFLMNKATVTLDKPVYVGQAILDLSKTLMYDWYYNDIKKQYPDARMMYTDTDSFVLLIKTKDFYKEIPLEKYDTSNYPKEHPCYSSKNKKVIGLPKDEGGGQPISEFACLRSKSYCVKFAEWDAVKILPDTDEIKAQRAKIRVMKDEVDRHLAKCELESMIKNLRKDVNERNGGVKKCKGVKKCVAKDLTFDTYKSCLFTGNPAPDAQMSVILSKLHELKNYTFIKKTLSAFDDKRYYTDNVNSYAHGHYIIK